MDRLLSRYSVYVYALLRMITGLMFACHGGQKLLNFPPGGQGTVGLSSLMGLGGAIELVCGFLVAFGFLGSYAAFLASGEMAVGYFMMHHPRGLLPINNHGEPAVLYCWIFLYIAFHGSGIWSVDSMMSGNVSAATETPRYGRSL